MPSRRVVAPEQAGETPMTGGANDEVARASPRQQVARRPAQVSARARDARA